MGVEIRVCQQVVFFNEATELGLYVVATSHHGGTVFVPWTTSRVDQSRGPSAGSGIGLASWCCHSILSRFLVPISGAHDFKTQVHVCHAYTVSAVIGIGIAYTTTYC